MHTKQRLGHILNVVLLSTALWACANRAADNGNNSGTLARTDDVVTASDEGELSKRARIRYELATGYFEQGKTTIALDELKHVLVLTPNFADGWLLRGLIYMRLSQPVLADESFRRARSLNPADGTAAHNYGWFLCTQKRYTEAYAQFNAAIATKYRGVSRTYMSLGICQIEAGLKTEAEESFVRSVELDPQNPISGYNLALLLYQRGQTERARFYVRRINNSDMANAETLWLGIRIEHKAENFNAKAQLAEQLRNRFPASNEAMMLDRGAYYEQ